MYLTGSSSVNMLTLGSEVVQLRKMNASLNQAVLSLMAELVLDESIRTFKAERLYVEIDHALANKDESTFLELTNELKALLMGA